MDYNNDVYRTSKANWDKWLKDIYDNLDTDETRDAFSNALYDFFEDE